MCLAIPGKVVSIDKDNAAVSYGKEERAARLINQDIKVGDYVVVQNKLILQKVPKKEALESIRLWEEALDEN